MKLVGTACFRCLGKTLRYTCIEPYASGLLLYIRYIYVYITSLISPLYVHVYNFPRLSVYTEVRGRDVLTLLCTSCQQPTKGALTGGGWEFEGGLGCHMSIHLIQRSLVQFRARSHTGVMDYDEACFMHFTPAVVHNFQKAVGV